MVSINSENTSNFVAAGFDWRIELGKPGGFYLRPGMGLAYTDGETGLPPVNAPGLTPEEIQRRLKLYNTRIDFGSKVLFEPELALGTTSTTAGRPNSATSTCRTARSSTRARTRDLTTPGSGWSTSSEPGGLLSSEAVTPITRDETSAAESCRRAAGPSAGDEAYLNMANVTVVGAQWGDEGKGKIVDWLSNRADVVVRFQGGHNAGHTLVVDGKVYKLALLPSGVVQGKLSVIGNGVVVDPWHLLDEIAKIAEQGVVIGPDLLVLADNAALILPLHRDLDQAPRGRCQPEDRHHRPRHRPGL